MKRKFTIKTCKDLYFFFIIYYVLYRFIYYFQTFTVENNVYKGEIMSYKYKSIGEIMWNKIKSHGDKIVHVSQSFIYVVNIECFRKNQLLQLSV